MPPPAAASLVLAAPGGPLHWARRTGTGGILPGHRCGSSPAPHQGDGRTVQSTAALLPAAWALCDTRLPGDPSGGGDVAAEPALQLPPRETVSASRHETASQPVPGGQSLSH